MSQDVVLIAVDPQKHKTPEELSVTDAEDAV